MRPRLTVVGDTLLDRDLVGTVERFCPDAPVPVVDGVVERTRPGGAGLAAWLASRDGADVTLITALAEDPAAAELRALLDDASIHVLSMHRAGATPEKTRVRADAQSIVRVDRGDARADTIGADVRALTDAIAGSSAVLVSDYGGGVTYNHSVRRSLAAAAKRLPVVWDPHPRGMEPVPGCSVVTPNRAEALGAVAALRVDLGPDASTGLVSTIAHAARALLNAWDAGSVCVTLGADGAALVREPGGVIVVPAPAVAPVDVCGAGDRFATAVALALADRLPLGEAVANAVSTASTFVSVGAGWPVSPAPHPAHGRAPAPAGTGTTGLSTNRPTARPGTAQAPGDRRARHVVVATSGCFDLLHAGHVRMLRAARALGDRLVVCLNDDDSVARLKGPARPIVPVEERAEVLLALDSVDDVLVFSEDTPERVLADVRPDIFTKGADYTIEQLPEAGLLASWGGETVILPYEAGRSTTELIARSRQRSADRSDPLMQSAR
jgi:rfaE bifunctional protein nucleotidyltransferase chain/domain/rfaE bifunctional protein kinase chain/domain